MGDPIVAWTGGEGWLMAELAQRALVATLDGGPPVRAPVFSVEICEAGDAIWLELRLDAARATLALRPVPPEDCHGHRWRDAWMLVVVRGAARWTLAAGGAPIEIELGEDRGSPVRVELAVAQRESFGAPLVDAAFYRYTRQSTLAPVGAAALAPWMRPTEPERAPWWELDLGRAMCVAQIRFDVAPLPPGTRVVCSAYGFPAPGGAPWPDSVVFDAGAESVAESRVSIDDFGDSGPLVARYVRIALQAPDGALVALAVTAIEVLASELYAPTLLETMQRAFARFAARPLCLARTGERGPFLPERTYADVWRAAMALARGLARRFEGGARVVLGVMLRNRAEWLVAELAALARGYLVVAMSPDDADDRLAQVLARAQPACVICEPAEAARLGRLAPTLVAIACGAPLDALIADGEGGGAVPEPAPRTDDDPYAVLFTSGSTGAPKGAVRSYRSFRAVIASYAIAHSPRHLSFQPLSHLSERMYLPALLVHGGALGFSRGGAHLLDELRALEPTTIGTVPRLFELLYAAHQRRVAAGAPDDASLREARAAFGGRLRALSVGSAPVGADVLAFLRRCFADLWVSEGYGATETGSIAFDGVVLPHVEVKLVPARDASDAAERGEIWVRTPHAIAGYLGDPGATAAAFDRDGFFATGDLGERGGDGRVRVIGRVRNTVKLAQGEFVSIERVEAALRSSPLVDRVFVHVAHGGPGGAALVVPHAGELARLLDARAAPLASLVAEPAAAAAALAALCAHGRAAGLVPYELPRAVLLEAAPFTVESGLLTPSGKLARAALGARYGAALAALAVGADPRASLGLDSLAVAELLEELSRELGREVPLSWWFEHGPGAAAELAAADRARAPRYAAAAPRTGAVRTVLLTGATGFLGAHLVESLCARGFDVVCLVRAPDNTAAGARLAAALAALQIAAPDLCRAIAGDLAAPELGLAGGFAALPPIDAIVHAGARVTWLAPYATLRGANVLGAIALFELAAARGIPIHHISTISTAPPDGDEDSQLSFAAALAATPYALSKWLAEDHARRAAAAGVAVTIHRPAMIAAHSQRGLGNRDDFVNRYLAGCLELGAYLADEHGRLDLTPVDFVADAIAAVLAARPRDGGTYHLANTDQSLTYAALGRAMIAAGAPLRPISYDELRAAVLADRAHRLHALAPFLPAGGSLGMGPWPCGRSVAALAALGVHRPRIDGALVARYVAALMARARTRE